MVAILGECTTLAKQASREGAALCPGFSGCRPLLVHLLFCLPTFCGYSYSRAWASFFWTGLILNESCFVVTIRLSSKLTKLRQRSYKDARSLKTCNTSFYGWPELYVCTVHDTACMVVPLLIMRPTQKGLHRLLLLLVAWIFTSCCAAGCDFKQGTNQLFSGLARTLRVCVYIRTVYDRVCVYVCIYIPYTTVYLAIHLPKTSYIHRIY
jgi:hypothetical protein